MKPQKINNLSNTQLETFDSSQKAKTANFKQENTLTKTRIQVRIPKHYSQEPVISRLISQHGLTVNIAAAILGANTSNDGWFDLEISGTAQQISNAQIYLNDLDLEVLSEPKYQEYCW
ncbi:MAG TPA: NIL domain-containing protein [Candidatus Sericytochromatia bacterium]